MTLTSRSGRDEVTSRVPNSFEGATGDQMRTTARSSVTSRNRSRNASIGRVCSSAGSSGRTNATAWTERAPAETSPRRSRTSFSCASALARLLQPINAAAPAAASTEIALVSGRSRIRRSAIAIGRPTSRSRVIAPILTVYERSSQPWRRKSSRIASAPRSRMAWISSIRLKVFGVMMTR